MYIQQRQGRVPEATAKYFMHQLGTFDIFFFLCCLVFPSSTCLPFTDGNQVSYAAAGLQILRDNNLIHRDLKPQVGYDTPCLPGLFINIQRSQITGKIYMILKMRSHLPTIMQILYILLCGCKSRCQMLIANQDAKC